jgi:hypothetical protein
MSAWDASSESLQVGWCVLPQSLSNRGHLIDLLAILLPSLKE